MLTRVIGDVLLWLFWMLPLGVLFVLMTQGGCSGGCEVLHPLPSQPTPTATATVVPTTTPIPVGELL